MTSGSEITRLTRSLDVAYHETGHAIVADDLGLSVILVELLEPEGYEEPTLHGRVVTAELERYRHVDPAEAWASDVAYRDFLERDLVQRMAVALRPFREQEETRAPWT